MPTALPTPAPGRPDSLRERKKLQTRDALIDSAPELFQEQGFAETTLDEVCARAEVSKRTFFRYFASKEDVVLASSHELWLAFLAEVETITPTSRTVFATLREALLTTLEKMTTPGWAERTAAGLRSGLEHALAAAAQATTYVSAAESDDSQAGGPPLG